MYRLKGQKSHFPLNCLLVPRKDGGSPKNNNYSIIQSSSHQNIIFFWFPCGVGFFLVLWCGIISNRTLLWSYVNRTAFFLKGESFIPLKSQASLGGGIVQHKTGVAHCSRVLGSPQLLSMADVTTPSAALTPWHPDLFPSSVVHSLARDPFLKTKLFHPLS